MTAERSWLPEHQQVNREGGTGFIGGQHNHYYGGYAAGSATRASRGATSRGVIVGPPITEWAPSDLGVHASITVQDETGLTPYIAREHDQQLREHLARAAETGGPTLVLVVGTSCTGKTRTLYEAVIAVLPDWQVTAPRTDSDVARLMVDGVPAHTIVWLDELQGRIPKTADGITAAKAIVEILGAAEGNPIVFVGTIWPTNLAVMQVRPTPDEANAGADVIPDLLARGEMIHVPECFTATDLDNLSITDPRLCMALDTAALVPHPQEGAKIIQVLAGGTQLVHRLNPPEGTHPQDEFSPAAKAVLHAAGDLRRVGMPNPIPRWAIEGAATGYLYLHDQRPAQQWLPAALAETTAAARRDDELTGSRSLDIHQQGIPALTPHWYVDSDNALEEGYDLHDYLYQDHLTCHRRDPTRPSLWDTLTTQTHAPEVAEALSRAAEDRGLYRVATALLQPHISREADRESHHDRPCLGLEQQLFSRLCRGDDAALPLLRQLADHHGSTPARHSLVLHLGRQAESGQENAWRELRRRANAGETTALETLCDLLKSRAEGGIVAALDELREWAGKPPTSDGVSAPRYCLTELLADRSRWDPKAQLELTELQEQWGSIDYAFDERGHGDEDDESWWVYQLSERAMLGDAEAFEQLGEGIEGRQTNVLECMAAADVSSARAEIERRASEGDGHGRYVTAKWLAIRAGAGDGKALALLRDRAKDEDDDPAACGWLADLLIIEARKGASVDAELSTLASTSSVSGYAEFLAEQAREGDEKSMERLRSLGTFESSHQLADILADQAEVDYSAVEELVGMVNEGLSGSAEALIRVYQRRNRSNVVIGLDASTQPVLRED